MSLVSSIIHITTSCLSKCITCNFWGNSPEFISKKDFFEITRQLKDLGVKQIMISGGEPLLHQDIVEMVRYVNQLGIKIMLNTNGILLDKFINDLYNYIDFFVISMDGSNPETYQKIRGVNAFDRVVCNVRQLKSKLKEESKENVSVMLRCTIQRHNLFDIFNIQNLANELDCPLGLNPIDAYSDNFGRQVKNINMVELIPNSEETERFRKIVQTSSFVSNLESNDRNNATWTKQKFNKLADYFDDMYKGKLPNKGNSVCSIPYTNMIFDANNDIKICFYHKIGNFLKDKSLYQFVEPVFLNMLIAELEKSGLCNNCRCKFFC